MSIVYTEEEIAALVVTWLEVLGADVYQEVECGSGVADIVARVGPELWVIETKTNFSLALLIQAMDRRRDAHRVFIAGPYSRHINDVEMLCRELGVGLLEVRSPRIDFVDNNNQYSMPAVRERCESRRWNSKPVALATRLRPEHKTHAKAGTAGGGRWTPFRDTCAQLARRVKAEPGISLKAAIDGIAHHYSSAKNARRSLVVWIELGKVDGVQLVRTSDGTHLQPSGDQ